jgi:hypothetical protein
MVLAVKEKMKSSVKFGHRALDTPQRPHSELTVAVGRVVYDI